MQDLQLLRFLIFFTTESTKEFKVVFEQNFRPTFVVLTHFHKNGVSLMPIFSKHLTYKISRTKRRAKIYVHSLPYFVPRIPFAFCRSIILSFFECSDADDWFYAAHCLLTLWCWRDGMVRVCVSQLLRATLQV